MAKGRGFAQQDMDSPEFGRAGGTVVSGQWPLIEDQCSKLVSQKLSFTPGSTGHRSLITGHFYGVTLSVIADDEAVIGLAPPVVALTVTL